MAKASINSNEVYNARRRFRRQAERNLAKAQRTSGIEKSRYMEQARQATISALQTYAKGQRPQGQVKKLAENLGVTQNYALAQAGFQGFGAGKSAYSKGIESLVSQSKQALQSYKAQQSRDDMARDILRGNVGSRFYAGLIDIWGDTPEHRANPNAAILEFFGADTMMDVLEQIEAEGIDIYQAEDNTTANASDSAATLDLITYIKQRKQTPNA